MIYVIVALQCEAKPLIKKWGLNRNNGENNWVVFENPHIKLIISGVGKVLVAMAVESLMAAESKKSLGSSFVVNFGTCGAVKGEQYNLGDIVMINKVVDRGSGRCYYPDMMVRHNFLEATIETFDTPVTDPLQLKEALVDMECSGFFQAAIRYFSLERIACLKIVSDHLEIENLKPKKVQNLITDAVPEFGLFIEKLNDIDFQFTPILTSEHQELLWSISSHLRLTQTNRSKFYKLAEGYLIRTQKRSPMKPSGHNCGNLSRLEQFLGVEVTSKMTSKRYFNELESVLNEDVLGSE